MTVRVGSVLGGRYQVVQRLAAGGMGDVWKAVDDVLGREVAVKVLRHELSEQAGFLDRFRREARHAAMLSHPGIATIFDYGEQDGSAYLVMEIVAGEDLARLLARERALPSDRVTDIVGQVASALAAAHDAGIVHRDIKPANLMITPGGVVKITDFGISRLTDSSALTKTGEIVGTPQYMAPEQVDGRATSAASDVYSVGVVAYEMLTGRPPFVADSNIAVAMAQLHQAPEPLPDGIAEPLVRVVARALAKDPHRRHPHGRALLEDLRAPTSLPAHAAFDPSSTPTRFMPPPPPGPAATAVASPAATSIRTGFMVTLANRAEPVIGSLNRHRHKRLGLVVLTVAATIGLVVAVVIAGRPGDDRRLAATDGAVTVPATAATPAPTVAIEPAATVAPPVGPPVVASGVIVDPAAYVGRDKGSVIAELRALGLDVDERKVETDRDTNKNDVVAIEPSGEVAPGSTVVVLVADPQKRNDEEEEGD